MGRDPDPTIKEALLGKILHYLLENGVQNLSLRPLAKAVGTNARMLIYHFGSKEQLIIKALELAQRHQIEALINSPKPKANSEAELVYLWQWFSSESFLPFGKLLLEIEVQAINGNAHYSHFATQIIEGWVNFIQSRFDNCDASPTAADRHFVVGNVSVWLPPDAFAAKMTSLKPQLAVADASRANGRAGVSAPAHSAR